MFLSCQQAGFLPLGKSFGVLGCGWVLAGLSRMGKKSVSCQKMRVSALGCDGFPDSAGAQQRPYNAMALLNSVTTKALPAWTSLS